MKTKKPSRILIVDDEPFNVDVLEQKLERLGYRTESAVDGQEALEKVAADPPDLILLDIMMPRIDGFTVCQMLKDDPKTRLIPIIIMTVLDATEDRIKGIEAGADDFLSKPVNDRELQARIQTTLKLKRTVDDRLDELHSARAQLAKFGRRDQDVSILFVHLNDDRRGSEAVTPAALDFLIERYLSVLRDRIDRADGEVADTPGNGLMAVFNDPDPRKHPVTAVETAFALVAETKVLNEDNRVQPLAIRLGVNSGRAVVGLARSEGQHGADWAFTASGAVPELATGLARAARDGEVIVGQETVERLPRCYRLQPLSRKRVKDHIGSAAAHRVLGLAVKEGVPSGDPIAGRAMAGAREGAEDVSTRQGMPWPDAYRDLRARVRKRWGVKGDIYLSRILSGKSGALVYAVDVTCEDFKGQAILKLSEALDPSWSEEEEADRHRRAIEKNTSYAAEHLPTIVHTFQHGNQIAILSTIAGRGLEYTVPWALCHYDRQLSAVRQLSKGLLEDWNLHYEFADGMQQPTDLLRTWLGYRLDPQAGRIHDFMAEHCGIRADESTFIFQGHWYPNPLAFIEGIHPPPERLQVRAIKGSTHGDLHGLNVLVRPRAPDELDYYLIDLALYSDSEFLFYDHAYLELSYLLQARESATLTRWKLILDAIGRHASKYGAVSVDDFGLIQLLGALRKEVFAWIDRHEANRLSYLESQYLLARVAAGLNFVNKPLAAKNRLVALLYGAICLKDYLKFQGIDWPKEGPALVFDDVEH
jgi:CheY-like chemotaxis protein